MSTRLLGRFTAIFYFNCEHFLFVYTVKQQLKQKFADLKKIVDFQNFHVYAPEILAVINNRKRNKNLKTIKDQQTIKKIILTIKGKQL